MPTEVDESPQGLDGLASLTPAGFFHDDDDELVYVDVAGEETVIQEDIDKFWAVSEDGSLLVEALHAGAGVRVVQLLTGEVTVVEHDIDPNNLVLSPDGATVLFGGRDLRWWSMDVASGTVSELALPYDQYAERPGKLEIEDWSPDGSLLVATVRTMIPDSDGFGEPGIALVSPDGTGWTFHSLDEFLPSRRSAPNDVKFGPDSGVVYFTMNREYIGELKVGDGTVRALDPPTGLESDANVLERLNADTMLVWRVDDNRRRLHPFDAEGNVGEPIINRSENIRLDVLSDSAVFDLDSLAYDG